MLLLRVIRLIHRLIRRPNHTILVKRNSEETVKIWRRPGVVKPLELPKKLDEVILTKKLSAKLHWPHCGESCTNLHQIATDRFKRFEITQRVRRGAARCCRSCLLTSPNEPPPRFCRKSMMNLNVTAGQAERRDTNSFSYCPIKITMNAGISAKLTSPFSSQSASS